MFGLEDRTIEAIHRFFLQQQEVIAVKIYGSRALGNYEPGSDIDLAIWTISDKDISARIKTGLEDLPTPYMFDVTDYDRISSQPLKEHIDRVGKAFYQRNP